MLQISIKTHNSLLLKDLHNYLKISSKFSNLVSFTLLPAKYKSFVVKKSPHVFGRSKEKYYLKTYLAIITFKGVRKKDFLNIFSLLKSSKYKEGLGLKFSFF